MRDREHSRRGLLKGGLASLGSLALAGCDGGTDNPIVQKLFAAEAALTYKAQTALLGPDALAPEYGEADIGRYFKPNGSTDLDDDAYKALAAKDFVDFKLKVDGLVDRPGEWSLAELRAMPSRTQITRHDCVEGWSCIGKWSGVRLSHLLDTVGVKDNAHFVVFHCADTPDQSSFGDEPAHFYGSIDLRAARHEQTILAYDMNDKPLGVPHGAPLRLRVERQLGYKMSKYVMRVELVESFAHLGDGRGGYWEDNGYAWYAGI
jgi:DMSO/TMAO reductase YedYZ molybdopterin-dependent catalytic subunit